MNLLNELLSEKKVSLTDLPSSFQKRAERLQNMVSQAIKAEKEYEDNPSDEAKKALEEADEYITAYEEDLVDDIEEYLNNNPDKGGSNEPTEKKGKGFGWLGFVALGLLTAGAYWVYSKDKEN